MPTFAVIRNNAFVETRVYAVKPAADKIKHENGVPQLRDYTEVKPSFDPSTEILEGPTYDITDELVTATWTKRNLTAQEIASVKDAAVEAMNGALDKPLLKILLVVVNDIRATRAKLNALIDATGQSATVSKFPNNQTTQIDMAQLKAAIKDL